jgi:hypothetical protein
MPACLALSTSAYAEGRARQRRWVLTPAARRSASLLVVVAGGVLTSLLGWRSVMFAGVPLGVAMLALTR